MESQNVEDSPADLHSQCSGGNSHHQHVPSPHCRLESIFRRKTVSDVQQSLSVFVPNFDWQKSHFKCQMLSYTYLASYKNISYGALDWAKNNINVIHVYLKHQVASSTTTECNVTCPFNALHFPTENKHKAAVVSREPRMKKEDSKWYINDRCHESVLQTRKWETLEQRRLKTHVMGFRIVNGLVGISSHQLVPSTSSTRGHDMRYSRIYSRTDYYRTICIPCLIPLWHQLPSEYQH